MTGCARAVGRFACMALIMTALMTGTAWSSQGVAHVYYALRALEQASPDVRAIVDPNLDAYLAGAVGPDIALTVYYAQLGMGYPVSGEEAHYERSGQLVNAMYNRASNDRERAFVLGWLTHWQVDCIIHPLVNRYGGYYEHDPVRHKHLEMFECAHVFNKWATSDPLNLYVTNPAAVPARLINAAYAAVYPIGWTTGRFRNTSVNYFPQTGNAGNVIPPSFETNLPGSAETMRIVTQALVEVQTTGTFSGGLWTSGSIYLAVKGPPPTKDEYKQLMNPIVIDKVEWEEPDRGAGETVGYINVTYTINDIRLLKAFADDWDRLRPGTISAAADRINNLVAAPAGYFIPDWNLDTGPGGFDENNRAHTWPGFPDIKDLLVHVHVSDGNNRPVQVFAPDLRTPWDATGEWVPCPPAEPQTWGQWIGWSTQEGTKTKVWGGPGGQAQLKIPVDASDPGPYRADLKLAFADRADKTAYGIDVSWNGILGNEPELSIVFLVDCSGSMAGSKIREAIAAVKASVANTNDGKTEWALIRFGGCRAQVTCQFTMEAGKVQAAADRLGASGDTPLSFAIAQAMTYLTTQGRGRQGRLIILADGEDNCGERGDKGPDEAEAAFRPMFIRQHDIQLPGRNTPAGASGGAR